MDLQKRFWVLTAMGLIVLIAGFLVFKAYEVDFLAFIVERTMEEKLHPAVSRERVRERFQASRQRFKTGRISGQRYEIGLLDAAAYIEKIQLLEQQDVDHIFQPFEQEEP